MSNIVKVIERGVEGIRTAAEETAVRLRVKSGRRVQTSGKYSQKREAKVWPRLQNNKLDSFRNMPRSLIRNLSHPPPHPNHQVDHAIMSKLGRSGKRTAHSGLEELPLLRDALGCSNKHSSNTSVRSQKSRSETYTSPT